MSANKANQTKKALKPIKKKMTSDDVLLWNLTYNRKWERRPDAFHWLIIEKKVGKFQISWIFQSIYIFRRCHVSQNILLTIPGVLGLSAGLWVKLPLWLVETVCDFLLLRPMASIDWLLLRMTRYRERWGDRLSADRLGSNTTAHANAPFHPRASTLETITGRAT